MSLEVGPRGSRYRVTQSITILGFLLVALIFIVSQFRHYQKFMAADVFDIRQTVPLNGTDLHTCGFHDVEFKGAHEEEPAGSKEMGDINSDLFGEADFELGVWSRLKERVCPRGVPKTSLGTTLFEQGRIEFGLDANATTSTNDPQTAIQNRKRTSKFFYDGGFGFTMFLDGVDPNNNLFYASIWKCANNQIHSYLERLFNRRANGSVRDSSRLDDFTNDTYLESLKIKDLKAVFREELERQNVGDKNEDNIFFTFNHTARTKPCVFTVLRDPISHFLSGYNEVEFRLIEQHEDVHHQKKGRTVELAPYTTIPFNESDHKREERFETFVQNLLMEHPSFSTFDYYKHFASMSRILPTLSRFNLIPSATWYLPTLENLTETFPAFLADRCPLVSNNYQRRQHRLKNNSNVSLPPMTRSGMHESSNDAYGTYKAAKDVWKQGGPAARALCVLHIFDYACFDLKIPSLCRDVYSSDQFVERILSNE